ncbi:MAG: cell division protein SepF [Micropruina sp.]|nr:cell division protein SepF [Micropruina sp.]
MADRLKKAAVWLGLVSDGTYPGAELGAEDETQQVARASEPRPEPVPASAAATVTELESRRGTHAVAQPSGPRTADINRIVTVHPRTYNEARTIGENFRDGVPVIMNLSDMEDSDAKRLVDFSAGLIFGLHGRIERITSKVFLLSPNNVNVTAEDKERIAGGFFNQS